MRKDNSGKSRGAVLLIVLWVLAAMGVLGVSFSAAIRTEVNAARYVVEQKQAFYLARAGVEYSVYKILEARSAFAQMQQLQDAGPGQIPDVLTGSTTLQLENGTAEIEIIDETGKINLNAPVDQTYVDMVFNLLIMVGVDPAQADIITDSIIDWRDADDYPGPNGAESDYYLSLEEPYLCKNGLFDVPDELLLVRGVTPEIYYGTKGTTENGEPMEFYGLQKYFTTFSRGSAININSAPLPVLAAVPYLDFESATRIHELRQEGPILDGSELMSRIPGLPTEVARLLSPSVTNNVYTLVSDGHLGGSDVVSRIRCVVSVDGLGPKGYSILYWNEAGTEL